MCVYVFLKTIHTHTHTRTVCVCVLYTSIPLNASQSPHWNFHSPATNRLTCSGLHAWFQWNLFVDVCFSQHRCSSDRQPPSAQHLLALILLGQRRLVHVHRAHRHKQRPHHGIWNGQQPGQPHLSGCAGLLQITPPPSPPPPCPPPPPPWLG